MRPASDSILFPMLTAQAWPCSLKTPLVTYHTYPITHTQSNKQQQTHKQITNKKEENHTNTHTPNLLLSLRQTDQRHPHDLTSLAYNSKPTKNIITIPHNSNNTPTAGIEAYSLLPPVPSRNMTPTTAFIPAIELIFLESPARIHRGYQQHAYHDYPQSHRHVTHQMKSSFHKNQITSAHQPSIISPQALVHSYTPNSPTHQSPTGHTASTGTTLSSTNIEPQSSNPVQHATSPRT